MSVFLSRLWRCSSRFTSTFSPSRADLPLLGRARRWGENALRVQVAPSSWTLTDDLPTAYLPGGAPGGADGGWVMGMHRGPQSVQSEPTGHGPHAR